MAADNEISTLNRILSYEKRAAATFEQVIPQGNSHNRTMWDLVSIRNDHNQAIGKLDHAIRDLGGTQGPNSNVPWPDIPTLKDKGVQDNQAAVKRLIEGEQTVIAECEKAIRNGKLGPLSKTLISSEILPVLQNHVNVLRQYL